MDFDGSEDLGRYFIRSKFILELLTGIALLILNISSVAIYANLCVVYHDWMNTPAGQLGEDFSSPWY